MFFLGYLERIMKQLELTLTRYMACGERGVAGFPPQGYGAAVNGRCSLAYQFPKTVGGTLR